MREGIISKAEYRSLPALRRVAARAWQGSALKGAQATRPSADGEGGNAPHAAAEGQAA